MTGMLTPRVMNACMWSVVALLSLIVWWLMSMPSIFDGVAWFAVIVLLTTAVAVAWFVVVADAANNRSTATLWRRIVLPPVALVVAVAIALSPLPARARFVLSHRSLDGQAQRVRNGIVINGRVGLYSIRSSQVASGEVRLTLHSGVSNTSTLVDAAPGGPAAGDGPCTHLGASWFLCSGIPDPEYPGSFD